MCYTCVQLTASYTYSKIDKLGGIVKQEAVSGINQSQINTTFKWYNHLKCEYLQTAFW